MDEIATRRAQRMVMSTFVWTFVFMPAMVWGISAQSVPGGVVAALVLLSIPAGSVYSAFRKDDGKNIASIFTAGSICGGMALLVLASFVMWLLQP